MRALKFNKIAAFIVPTGIGAKIGGYAGDASPEARKIAEKIPLIVNPNVVNAACFSGITDNMFYVEGWAINEFCKGNLGLKPAKNNKIGVIFDAAISKEVLNIHINTINAAKTVYDIDIMDYVLTDEPVGVEFFEDESGISSGGITNPETLLRAGKILKGKGAQAIAVVCRFEEADNDSAYESGDGVDIIGGVEGIISHYLSKNLMLPCVHAPAFDDVTIKPDIVHPKAAAEYITPTFLPCLFFGLQNAPALVHFKAVPAPFAGEGGLKGRKGGAFEVIITIDDLAALITPADALGNASVLECAKKGIKIIAVEENSTVLNVDARALGIENKVTIVKNYEDCLQYL